MTQKCNTRLAPQDAISSDKRRWRLAQDQSFDRNVRPSIIYTSFLPEYSISVRRRIVALYPADDKSDLIRMKFSLKACTGNSKRNKNKPKRTNKDQKEPKRTKVTEMNRTEQKGPKRTKKYHKEPKGTKVTNINRKEQKWQKRTKKPRRTKRNQKEPKISEMNQK